MIELLREEITKSVSAVMAERTSRTGELSFIQLVGNPSIHGKAIFIVLEEGEPLCTLKISRGSASLDCMRNEKHVLEQLSHGGMSKYIPRCYADGTFEDSYYLIQEYAGEPIRPGAAGDGRTWDMGLEILRCFYEETSQVISPGRKEFEIFVKSPVDRFWADVGGSEGAVNLLAFLEKEIVGSRFVITGRHGDFWPGNIMMRDGRPVVIDWDFARMSSLPLYDAFYFLALADAIRVPGDVGDRLESALIRESGTTFSRLGPLFESLGIDPSLGPALLCLFAVEAAVKQISLQKANAESQFVLFPPGVDGLPRDFREKLILDTFPQFALAALEHYFGSCGPSGFETRHSAPR